MKAKAALSKIADDLSDADSFIGAVEDLVSEHFVDTGDEGPYEASFRRVQKYLFEQS